MQPDYTVIGISVAVFVAIGIIFIIFPAAVLRWGSNVLLPFLYKRLMFIRRRLGMEERTFEPYEPGPNVIKLARVAGVWYIVVAVLFLVAILGLFN